jgi:hypothetical protein
MNDLSESTPQTPRTKAAPRRRLRVLDLLILTATTLAGLALSRALRFLNPMDTPSALGEGGLSERVALPSPLLALWAVALFVLRLSPPRPRRLPRQAGFVATLAVVLALLWRTTEVFHFTIADQDSLVTRIVGFFINLNVNFPDTAGFAVIFGWVLVLLNGRCARADWIDWLGRILGVIWIVVGLINHFNV